MKPELIENNFIHVPGFLHPKEASALAQDLKTYCVKRNLGGDAQVPLSQSAVDYLPFIRLLVGKIPRVSEIVGESLIPTYTFGRVYHNGAKLVRHTDRAACEVSVTVNLSKDTEWPIGIERPDGTDVGIELDPGDAVVYLGYQADHWRHEFDGQEYIQAFLHYVRAYGPNSWAYFDRQR